MSRFGRYEYTLKQLVKSFISNTKPIAMFRENALKLFVGTHPNTNPLHHQWAMNRLLISFARKQLNEIPKGASVLDVGVGSGPYWDLRPDLNWQGLDITDGERVDYLITGDLPWPIENKKFDVVLCTQVIEHVEDPDFLVSEIERVLKSGGRVILNAPFLYPFHGMPDDQMRYTTTKLTKLFKEFDVLQCGVLGGVGSSLATIILNFVNYKVSQNLFLQIVRLFLLPIWLVFNAICNLLLVSLDKIDNTNSFPLNTYLIAISRQKP